MKKQFFSLLAAGLLISPVIYSQDSSSKPVVAILNFSNTGGQFYLDELKQSFPAKLKTELSQKKSLTVVERQKLDEVLKEQDFSMSDLTEDKDKQAKVGQLLGADFIITGDISESGGKIRIDAAITQTSSGKVTGEKVTGPSKDYVNAMAELLANNIAFDLTGEGARLQRMKLKGAPATALFISTAALGAATAVAWKTHDKWYDKYKQNTRLGNMNTYYNKANSWYKATGIIASATAVSLGAWIYAVIKNKTTDREIFAHNNGLKASSFWVLSPVIDAERKNTGLHLSIQF